MSTEEKLQAALRECKRLKEENKRYREILDRHGLLPREPELHEREKIIRERINLFMAFFRGRHDVYAVRWEKGGEVGYSPVTRADGSYEALTAHAVYQHLSGEKTLGLYALMNGNTCWFLALDFDKTGWEADVIALSDICRKYKLDTVLERSRSGRGCHVWIFFSEPVRADTARKLGYKLVEKAAEAVNKKKLPSFDRMFPTQNELKEGGIGNLIALPLQGRKRKEGNTVFINDRLEAIEDQWGYLYNRRKYSERDVESILAEMRRNHVRFEEKRIEDHACIMKEGLLISKTILTPEQLENLKRETSFHNPDYYKAKAKRRSTNRIPSRLNGYEESDDAILIPRGKSEDVQRIVPGLSFTDERCYGSDIDVNLLASLYPGQEEAVRELVPHHTGTLSAATGFGKTVVAAALIHERSVNTLVLVHRNQLLDQWKMSLQALLDINPEQIGRIGGGKHKPTGIIDIATIQTIRKRELTHRYGQVIVDECHHISAFSFEEILKKMDAAYVHGLTATPVRKDGLHPFMLMQCGPVRYKVTAKEMAEVRTFRHLLKPRRTAFKVSEQVERDFQNVAKQLIRDDSRNDLIFDDILQALEDGRSPLVLTERVEHIELLEKKLHGFVKNIIVLTGQLSKKEEKERLNRLKEIPDSEERLILATGKYIGEGFDDPRLDTLFLVYPVGWKGTLEQYVGRLHRAYDGKESVEVYDYADDKVRMLKAMYEKRLKGYKSLGYEVEGEETGEAKQIKLF